MTLIEQIKQLEELAGKSAKKDSEKLQIQALCAQIGERMEADEKVPIEAFSEMSEEFRQAAILGLCFTIAIAATK